MLGLRSTLQLLSLLFLSTWEVDKVEAFLIVPAHDVVKIAKANRSKNGGVIKLAAERQKMKKGEQQRKIEPAPSSSSSLTMELNLKHVSSRVDKNAELITSLLDSQGYAIIDDFLGEEIAGIYREEAEGCHARGEMVTPNHLCPQSHNHTINDFLCVYYHRTPSIEL